MLRSSIALRNFSVRSFGNWKVVKPVSHVHYRESSVAPLFSRKRDYSTESHGWQYDTAPLPRAHDVLLNPAIHLPQHAMYTILNPENITRALSDVHLHFLGLGTSKRHQEPYRLPRDLIVLNPERIALHHIAATIATEVRVEDEQEFITICRSLQKETNAIINERRSLFLELREELEATAYDLSSKHRHTENDNDPLVNHFLNIRRAITARQSKLNWNTSQVERIATQIVKDDMLRDRLNFDIHDIVVDQIMREINRQHFTALENFEADREQIILLPQYSNRDRLTKIISGGIATGKSSVAKRFAAQLKAQYGTSIHDFAKISTDNFRLLLLEDRNIGSNVDIRSAVTQDEARMMFELAVQLLDRKLDQHGYAPHVFIEAISPSEAEIALGTKLKGALQIDVTHFPNEADAVHGNYKRYLDKQDRLPPVSAVLGSQQLISNDAPTLFNKHRGKDIVMTLHNTYKIIHGASDRHEVIAHFSFKEDRMYIFDVNEILNFVKKTYIDPSAKCEKSVYPQPDKISLTAISQCFFDHYGNKEIFFIDPDVHVDQYHESAKHAYAYYHPQRGLIIRDRTVFAKMVRSDASIRSLFDALKPSLVHHLDDRATYRHC